MDNREDSNAENEHSGSGSGTSPESELLFLRAVVNSVGEAVSVTDLENRLLFVNEAFCKLYGYSAEELRGQPISIITGARISPELREQIRLTTRSGTWQGELWNRRKDGTEFPIRLSTAPVVNESGVTIGLVGVATDISELKRAEESLRISDERYRSLFERSQTGVYIHDLEGNFIDASDAVARMLGYRREDAPHLSFSSIMEEKEAGRAKESIGRILRDGRTNKPATYRVRRGDGTCVWVETEASLLYRDGKPYAIHGIARDVTQARRAEEELRKNEERLRLAMEAAQLGWFDVNVQTGEVKVSPEYVHIIGFRPDDFQTDLKNWMESIHPDERETMAKVFAECLSSGESRIMEYRRRTGSGDWKWIRSIGKVAAYDEANRPLRMIGTHADISERKKAEQEVAEWKSRYDQLSQLAGMIVCDCNITAGSVVWGGSVQAILGYTVDELAGGIQEWASMIHPDARQSVLDRLREASAGKTKFSAEYLLRHKDGHDVLVSDTRYPIPGDSESSGRYVGIIEDITQRKRAESERAELEEQLRQAQKMESIGRLAGGVAHDFNNLLTVINGYGELVMDSMEPSDPLRENVRQIRVAGERASALTAQLLAFSRKQVLQPKSFVLDRAIRDLKPMLQRLLGEDIEMNLDLRAAEAIIVADQHQIEQVVLNLAVNSRDAMPRGGKLVIATSVPREPAAWPASLPAPGHVVHLEIADTGIGMDEATRQRIFEPFFTTKEMGKGTGLGLSTVQGIISQSGGMIDVASSPGKGTTFHVYLPLAGEKVPESSASQPEPAVTGSGTILVVEDQKEVRRYVSAALRANGYHIVAAEDPEEALLLCRQGKEKFDLLLTDVVMPAMSGRELADQIGRIISGIPVLFMSGYTGDVVVRHGISTGGVGFIQKPFSPRQLADKVREMLARGA